MKKANSYLLHKGVIDGESYLIIATMHSNNSKTGDMVQICILLEDTDPVAGVLSGLDAQTICQGCPFASGEGCYVNLGQSPLSIWKAYHRGNVPFLRVKDYPVMFSGRKVRFGSYGNPTLIPLRIVQRIASIADGFTGYFHNWRELGKAKARKWNKFFMHLLSSLMVCSSVWQIHTAKSALIACCVKGEKMPKISGSIRMAVKRKKL